MGKSDAEDEGQDCPDEANAAEDVYEDDFEDGGDEDDGEIETEIEGAFGNSGSTAASSVPTDL